MAVEDRVRRATQTDVAEIVRLAVQMYSSVDHHADEAWVSRMNVVVAERLDEDLVGWVVDAEGRSGLAACALLNLVPHLSPPGQVARWRGHVQWVSTDPADQRAGLGRALMEALMAYAESEGIEVLGLHATPAGRPLYERLGFEKDEGGTPMRARLPRRTT